jgi:molybdopterin-binding protein
VNVKQVLVSKQQVETSARNSFRGVVRKIEQSGDRTVLVTAECGPDFNLRATLTERAVKELGTGVGDEVWMHFKSTAVYVHD